MKFNPFEQKPISLDKSWESWKTLYPKSYDKNSTDPFTKTRVILMNGTEFEQNWFLHQFSRHCPDNELRREIARIRRAEQQQQKKINCLKPINETILETTIGYEQLAVDLTAALAQNEPDADVKMALDFALLEDFDHLYRYADLLDLEHGIKAGSLVGEYTEITPGRPTIAEHRYPTDNIRKHIDAKTAHPLTKLNTMIITAAEQQTMNYYMNVGAFYTSDLGRRLYQEIALIEEQHVSQYESLIDVNCTWLECLLMHEYCECYLYYSMALDEPDPCIKSLWEQFLEMEISHLHHAAALLKKYEKKDWREVIPDGNFPTLLKFHSNKNYVRDVIKNTVWLTSKKEEYVPLEDLPSDAKFFDFQKKVNADVACVPSHDIIARYIDARGEDYRVEDAPHPIEEMRDRTKDNVEVGRVKH